MSATTLARRDNAEKEAAGTRPGYYLVKGGARHFIAATVNVAALERVADRVLSEKKGWNYWIDYSHGVDINGNAAWDCLDHTGRFI